MRSNPANPVILKILLLTTTRHPSLNRKARQLPTGTARFRGPMTTPAKLSEFKHLGEPEPALVHGRLVEVDPGRGAAILSGHLDSLVRLRYAPSLEREVLKLAKRTVKVSGHGWFDEADQWIAVVIEDIALATVNRPFDLDEFLNETNPGVFHPDNVSPMLMSDEEWDAFDRALRESRGRRES